MSGSFYGRIYAEGYDEGDGRHAALAFYLRQWELLGRPAPVLEPMCGTGFFLAPLLAAGADIDGLDSSPHMLAVCRQKCARLGRSPRLFEQRIEEMQLDRRYGLILIPDRSFAHVYDPALAREGMRRLFEHTEPGG